MENVENRKKIGRAGSMNPPDAPHAPWPRVKLGEVAEEMHDRIDSSSISPRLYISTENMLKNGGGIVDATAVPQDTSLVAYSIGDILISNIRPFFKKIWLADRDGGCSSDVVVFRKVRSDVTPEYLRAVLSQDAFIDHVMLKASGTKMPRGNRQWMLEFDFPLPPLPVQHAIVAKLERELAAVDAMEKKFAEMEKTAKTGFKAELKEAFDELTQRRRGAEVRSVKLGEVCELKAGGDKPKIFSHLETEVMKVPVVSNGIENDGICGYTDQATVFSKCVTVSARGTIGWVCVRGYPFVPIVRLIVATPHSSLDVQFLAAYLQQLSIDHTGSSIPQLTVPMIKDVMISLPDIPTQRAIVARLDAARMRSERLVSAARKGAETAALLRKALLKEAFE